MNTTFEKLCPIWSDNIKTRRLREPTGLAINKCIIGEAYGFKDTEINCRECHDRGAKLVNNMDYISGYRDVHPITHEEYRGRRPAIIIHDDLTLEIFEKDLKRQINGFMRHWNKVHEDK